MAYTLDLELSRRFAKTVGAKPRECYSNALMVFAMAKIQATELFYCEGYAASSELMIPIQHGWVEMTVDGHSVIVDPTWCNKNETIVYHPLVRLVQDDIDKLFRRRKNLKMPVMDFYRDELIERNKMTRMTQHQFMDMLDDFNRELNEATKTIGDES